MMWSKFYQEWVRKHCSGLTVLSLTAGAILLILLFLVIPGPPNHQLSVPLPIINNDLILSANTFVDEQKMDTFPNVTTDRFYPIQPNVCPRNGKHPYLVIFIPSRPPNGYDRSAIRETWGMHARFCDVRIVFGFGIVPSREVQREAYVESSVYGDLLQVGDILDSYHNQTQLVLAFFEWGATHCQGTRFIGKADEDAWINVHELLKYLQMPPATYSVTGYFIDDAPVYRNTSDKWYVSESDFPNSTFPKFPLGQLYVFPTNLIPDIIAATPSVQCVWLDDVCLGGQVREFLQIPSLDIAERIEWLQAETLSLNCSHTQHQASDTTRSQCPCAGRDWVIIDHTPAEAKRTIFYDICNRMYRQYRCPLFVPAGSLK